MSDTEEEKIATTEEEKEEITDLSDRYVFFLYWRCLLESPISLTLTYIHTPQRCLHEIPRSGQDCESRLAGIGVAMRTWSKCLGFVRIWTHGHQHASAKALYQESRRTKH